MIVPGPTGSQTLTREGTQVGSPSQPFRRHKAIGVLDWDLAPVGATTTGRYVSKLRELGGNVMDSVFYTDLQLGFTGPSFAEGLGFAVGVNNLFDVKTPGCVTCESNNFAQSVYDTPAAISMREQRSGCS